MMLSLVRTERERLVDKASDGEQADVARVRGLRCGTVIVIYDRNVAHRRPGDLQHKPRRKLQAVSKE